MRRSLILLPLVLWACGASSPPPAPAPSPSAAPAASAGASAGRELHYSVTMMDHVAGATVVTVHPDGSRDATFAFNDRGRGPDEKTHLETGADGVPSRIDVTGVSYLKRPVDEHFAAAGGKRTWSNPSEKGDAPPGSPALYVPLEGAPELFAAQARALLASPSHELPLLPAGKARIARAGELTVTGAGGPKHVVRYELDGYEFEPDPVWLDDEGELFAVPSPWFAVVREGYEGAVPQLIEAQREAQAARLTGLAQRLTHRPPAAGLAIVHARLFDVSTKKVVPDATIVVRGDRIVAVGPGSTVKPPKDAEILDAKGQTALPGLWDMHSHVAPLDGLLDLASGVTGARDLGNEEESLLRTQRAWDAGTEIGPRMVRAGFIDGRGPFQAPTKVFADTVDEGKHDIDAYASKGYEQIKLYSSLKPELVAPLAAYAHGKGLRVSGHVPNGMSAAEAVAAGYDEIQHANFLLLNFLAQKSDDTRTPLRFTLVGEKAAALDLDSAAVKAFVKLLVDHKTVIDPTLVTFEPMYLGREGQMVPSYAAIADRLPVQVRRGFLTGGLPIPDGMDATYRASFAAMGKLVKRLWDAGVRVVAGTDALAGFSLHRELELYVDAGIPAPDVLVLATLGAARVVRHDKDWGSIAPGKFADLVLVDGQPDVKISDIRRPVTVMKAGATFACADLLAAINVLP